MNTFKEQKLISQAEYAKTLYPLLPAEAFVPDSSKLLILLINLAILVLGWAIIKRLDYWSLYLLWLYLPLALVMSNSIIVLLFSSHDLMHGSVIRNSCLIRVISLLGLTLWWMPPTLWKAVHNKAHHNKTNSLTDPDRNYLYDQPKTWGKWIQNAIVPSSEVNIIGLTLGMATAWGYYAFRNLTSVVLFNRDSINYIPATIIVSAKERRAIVSEFFVILMIHLSVLIYLEFNTLKLLLSYFLPMGISYCGVIFYVYTNHILCRMTSFNDPLLNSISIRVPQIFNTLHLNFSYHTEHHIFPGMNSDYYPIVQELLKIHYPERFNYLDARDVWRLLLQTPRFYKSEDTLTDWLGKKSVPCPLSKRAD